MAYTLSLTNSLLPYLVEGNVRNAWVTFEVTNQNYATDGLALSLFSPTLEQLTGIASPVVIMFDGAKGTIHDGSQTYLVTPEYDAATKKIKLKKVEPDTAEAELDNSRTLAASGNAFRMNAWVKARN